MLKILNKFFNFICGKPPESSAGSGVTLPDSVEIREKVKLLADGFSIQSKHSNRIWLSMALLLLFALFAMIEGPNMDGQMQFLGQSVAEKWFYFISTIVSTILYFVFCTAYSQAFQAAEKFGQLMEDIENGNSNKTYLAKLSWKDAAHLLYHPTYMRVYPLTHALSWKWAKIFYFVSFRIIAVVFYFLLPAATIFAFLLKDKPCWLITRQWGWNLWIAFFSVILIVLLLLSLPLLRHELCWACKQVHKEWKHGRSWKQRKGI